MKFLKINTSHTHIFEHFCAKFNVLELSPLDGMREFFDQFYWPSNSLEISFEKAYGWECITIPYTHSPENESYMLFMEKIVKPYYGISFDFRRPYHSLLNIIEYFNPDFLYLHEAYFYTPEFVKNAKKNAKNLKKVVGWNCAVGSVNLYHNMIELDHVFTCADDIHQNMISAGIKSHMLGHSFDSAVLKNIKKRDKKYNVVFTGSIGATKKSRFEVLQALEKSDIEIDIYCPNHKAQEFFKKPFLAPKWGVEMYQLLMDSKIIVNIHAETSHACNMRLYETTGVGSCLLTDNLLGLDDIFGIDREVVSFKNPYEAIEKIDFYLNNDKLREEIAKASQKKTLENYTHEDRVKVVYEALCR